MNISGFITFLLTSFTLLCAVVGGRRGEIVPKNVIMLRRRVLARDYVRTFDSFLPSPRVKRLPIRPQQTISGQIVPLESEGPPAKYVRKPRKKQLASDQLRKLLGDHFDENWMSETKPDELIVEPTIEEYDESLESKRLYNQLSRLNVTADLHSSLGLPISSEVVEAVEYWLVRKSLCPIRFVWEEVGPLFWPPWIKRGECNSNDFRPSCSWPPGMSCMPSEVRAVHLLRWHCRPQNIRRKRQEEPEIDKLLPETATEIEPDLENITFNFTRVDNIEESKPEVNVPDIASNTEIPPIKRRQQSKRRTRVRCEWLKVPYPVTSSCFCSC